MQGQLKVHFLTTRCSRRRAAGPGRVHLRARTPRLNVGVSRTEMEGEMGGVTLRSPREPSSLLERRVGRVYVWVSPFLTGAILGLITLQLLYPAGASMPRLFLWGLLNLGLFILLWLKFPWARQRPIALVSAGVAGYGGMVGCLLVLASQAHNIDLGNRGWLLAATGIVLFVCGTYYAQLFRAGRTSDAEKGGAG